MGRDNTRLGSELFLLWLHSYTDTWWISVWKIWWKESYASWDVYLWFGDLSYTFRCQVSVFLILTHYFRDYKL